MEFLPRELIEAACYYCDPKRCKDIFDAGFDINTQGARGVTILMLAVMPDRYGDIIAPKSILALVESFLENGANPNLIDCDGLRASDYAKHFVDPLWKDDFGYPLKLNKSDVETINYIIESLEQWGE